MKRGTVVQELVPREDWTRLASPAMSVIGAATNHQQHATRPANPTVSVVVPTLNEARNLPYAFSRLPSCVTEVIVVDGRSQDDTIAVASALRPDVRVVNELEPGKGAALRRGFSEVTGDIVVMLDADGSADGGEIPRYIDALLSGADFAKGSRFLPGGGSADITRIRAAGNRTLTGIVNTLCQTHYTDLCYGYNAFWRDCLDHVRVDVSGFEVETRLNMLISRQALKVVEVPSFEYHRIHGVSNLHAVRDGMRVLRTIMTTSLELWRDRNRIVPEAVIDLREAEAS
jgi:glycosyltransferase involved in cell wall biosynthesis